MAEPAPNPYTRRVQRLARLRKAVAAALVVAAVVVVAIYFVQRRHRIVPNAPLLGVQVQQSAKGVDISKTVNGRPVFRVFASRADKLRSGGLVELHVVRILVYDRQGNHADEITGSSFRYNQATGTLQAGGEVHIQLQNRINITARGLTYNVKQGTGGIARGVQFAMGAAHGRAGSMQLDSRNAVADFAGGVHLDWPRSGQPDLSLTSDQARLRRLASDDVAVQLHGHAILQQGARSLTADSFTALVGSNYVLHRLDAAGHVVAAETAAGNPLHVHADRGHAEFTASTQKLQHLELEGNVVAVQTQTVRGGQQVRRLRAGTLEFAFAPANVLHSLVARNGAVLSESGAVSQQLAAPELDFGFRPGRGPAPRHGPAARLPQLATVSSRGRTHLVRGPLRAASDHLELTLAANQQPRLAIATGNVRLRQTLHGVERDSQAQRLQIEFATALHRSPQPRQVIESGGVQLRIGQRQLSAQRLVYTPGDGKAVLTGGVRGSSPQASFAAQAATWISRPDGSATLIAHAAPSRHIELSLSGRTPDFGPMLTANRPVVVTASSLHWSQPPAPGPAAPRPSLSHAAAPALGFRGTAVFTGSVRLLQAPNLLRADQLTLISGARGAPSGLVASGHVHTDFVAAGTAVAGLAKTAYSSASKSQEKPRDVQVQAAHLHYSVASRQARYTGGVSLTLDNAVLTAPQLDLYLSASARAPALERAQASGGVRVRQPGRRAHADRLSFDFAKDQIRLDGGPPSILDAEQGKITGDPLTFSLSSDEIQVGGKLGTRVLGKTKGHN